MDEEWQIGSKTDTNNIRNGEVITLRNMQANQGYLQNVKDESTLTVDSLITPNCEWVIILPYDVEALETTKHTKH